jgi:metal-responsive CopG/Arc/MetJ family transcriptional regulator
MGAQAVQVLLDPALLRAIDGDPEARRIGRSAFIRRALTAYLEAKKRRDVDDAISRAYRGKADELFDDVRDLIGAPAWPKS